MPSQYVQAKHCQLFRTDLEALLLLPTRVIFSTQEPIYADDSAKLDTRIPLPTLGGTLSALLTETHARASILNTIVRVLVPNSKKQALLLSNPYVQQHREQEESKQLDETKEAMGAGLEPSAQPPSAQRPVSGKEMAHRIGRVVALLPKPKSTDQSSQNRGASPADELLSSYLLAVHLGEKIELFPIQSVSNEVLSEPEHVVYLHSTLGRHSTTRPSAKSAVPNTADNFILNGEQVEAVKSHLKDLRAVFEGVRLYQEQKSRSADGDRLRGYLSRAATHLGVGAGAPRVEHAPAFKRSRGESGSALQWESDSREEITDLGREVSPHTKDEDEEVGLEQARHFGAGERSQATRFSRFIRENEQLTQQVDQFRQMLHSRDESLAELHKQLRQAEEQHKSQLSQWRLKELEERKVHERVVLDYQTKLKENEALLQKADQKLRELAKMTVKYKGISDEIMRRMGLKGKSPEEALALLKDDKYSTPL